MDFIDWCMVVYGGVVSALERAPQLRGTGVGEQHLKMALFGDGVLDDSSFQHSSRQRALFQAVDSLVAVGLLEHPQSGYHWLPSRASRQLAPDLTPLWEAICAEVLDEEEAAVVRAINRLSARTEGAYCWLELIEHTGVLCELDWNGGYHHFAPIAKALHAVDLLSWHPTAGGSSQRATYRGLVWDTRRGFTLHSRQIDGLVQEWETTSVDFKQELRLDTASDKAEVVKDVTALANTQASGRRWLVVGFVDKTRAYYGPPNPALTQDRFEQILSEYVAPAIDVRYEVWDYRAGKVGILEILRDPTRVPYRVARSIGEKGKRRVEAGQVFVRHGSHTAEASEEELRALAEERAWFLGTAS